MSKLMAVTKTDTVTTTVTTEFRKRVLEERAPMTAAMVERLVEIRAATPTLAIREEIVNDGTVTHLYKSKNGRTYTFKGSLEKRTG